MKIIDTHTHIFPEKVVGSAITALNQSGRHILYYDGTLDGLLSSMRQHGISRSITLPVATKAAQVRSINEFASSQPRESCIPFGGIHPDCEDPAAVLREFPNQGLLGFKMHPEFQECAPNEPRMEPILETASDLGLIAYFHAGRDVGPQTNFGNPKAFAEVLDAYPNLKVVLAHFGGYLSWDEVAESLIGRNVWLDTAYTFADIDKAQFLSMLAEHDPEKVLFGSDGPWVDPNRDIAYLNGLGLSDEMLEGIFHANAEKLLASA